VRACVRERESRVSSKPSSCESLAAFLLFVLDMQDVFARPHRPTKENPPFHGAYLLPRCSLVGFVWPVLHVRCDGHAPRRDVSLVRCLLLPPRALRLSASLPSARLLRALGPDNRSMCRRPVDMLRSYRQQGLATGLRHHVLEHRLGRVLSVLPVHHMLSCWHTG
jgi:hypothetical protein